MQIEKIAMSGEVELTHYDANMQVIDKRVHKNLVVNLGLAHIVSRLKDATAAVMDAIAVGGSATAAAASQSALVAIIGTKVAVDSTTIVTKNVANDTIQHICTFGPGVSTGALNEAGIFNSANVMLSRIVFPSGVVNKGADDTVVITWKITAVAA